MSEFLPAFLVEMLEINVAGAVAIIAVLLVRKQIHRFFGPGAAYLLWTVVPVAMLAMLIPSREVLVDMPTSLGAENFWSGVVSWFASPLGASILLLVWLGGAALMTARLVARQRLFLRDVELGVGGPAVVGFFYPRIVTPHDFGQRFSPFEQKLIIAHEQVHLERYDARINAGLALARSLFWFNPLVHLGAKQLRADQELSCDAAVIERRPKARRVYAETLLKTQLESRPLPVGCYWPPEAQHPLTERVGMLTRKPLSHPRRLAAAAVMLTLVGGAGFTAWAAQPAREVLTDMPEVFVMFEPVQDDGFPGLKVRLLSPAEASIDTPNARASPAAT